jgi:hypothetical protein
MLSAKLYWPFASLPAAEQASSDLYPGTLVMLTGREFANSVTMSTHVGMKQR